MENGGASFPGYELLSNRIRIGIRIIQSSFIFLINEILAGWQPGEVSNFNRLPTPRSWQPAINNFNKRILNYKIVNYFSEYYLPYRNLKDSCNNYSQSDNASIDLVLN